MSQPDNTENDVRIERAGLLGRIILNRPSAINALTHDMALRIDRTLCDWSTDNSVGAVLITGAGERGLCAGGDIRAIYRDATEGGTATLDFWRDEYRLNARIAGYPKPIVAIMHGLVMGGGVGISAHASQRIVTDGSVLAMPEVGIGLVPDVGGTWLLARAPGELGTHAALTTARLGPGEAIELGLADWYVPAEHLPALIAALSDLPPGEDDPHSAVGEVIQSAASLAPHSTLSEARHWIDRCYAADTVEEILRRLADSPESAAASAPKEIAGKSPTALKVTLEALRRARRLGSLEAELNQELRVSARCFAAPDLAEGIRAQVIDKDRNPRWSPATLEQVSAADVTGYFAPLGAGELGLVEPESSPTGAAMSNTEVQTRGPIAVIGLGNMGGPMAANLVAAGHRTIGFDLSEAARQRAAEAGVRLAGSAADAAREASVVITMLPAGRHVLECYLGRDDADGPVGSSADGIVAAARPGALLIDCSTIDVGSAREAHAIAAKAGLLSVDAPVSGGVVGATAATLTFMIGGEPAALAAAEPILARLGRRTVRCGGAGA
ncbi:MAG TPA: 3-hydroxyisobutyryl-CoA hydrolase, partial [Pseudonocardia sp.]